MTNITRWDLALKQRTAKRKWYEKRLAECLQQLAPVMKEFEAQVETGNIQIVNAGGEHYYGKLIDVVHCVTFSMAHASFWERKIAEAKRHWRRVSDHLRTRTKGGFRLHIRRSTILSDREGSDWALTAFDVLISFPGRTHEPSRQELPPCATT